MRYKKCRNNGQYDLLHRKIMEQHVGRKLLSTEVVHHINGDKLDNRLENLELMSKSEHCALTMRGVTLSNETKRKISISLIGNQRHKGILHNSETKAKISESLMGNQRRKGTTVPLDVRERISASVKKARSEKFWSSRKPKNL